MGKSALAAVPLLATHAPRGESRRQFACLIVAVDACGATRGGDVLEEAWLAACRDLTPAVERLSPQRALLDLDLCSPEEARAAMATLMEHVAHMGTRARAGIAPSLVLAELAALMATPDYPLLALAPDALQGFLRRVPVTALPHLAAAGPDRVTAEVVERLERYGLRRLSDLARLSEPALCRQFGAAGGFLAAVAAGRDERPLQHTPAPVEWRVRLRLGAGGTPECALAALRPFSEWMAARLRDAGRQTRRVRVRLRWECGCAQSAHLSLRRHTHDAIVLTQELRRLVAPLLATHSQRASGGCAHAQALDGVWIALGDFAPVVPSQATFWRTREQHVAAARLVADTLARRHGQPLLLRAELAQPAAVYGEERHQLAALPAAEPKRALGQQRREDVARLNGVSGSGPWQTVPQRLHWW